MLVREIPLSIIEYFSCLPSFLKIPPRIAGYINKKDEIEINKTASATDGFHIQQQKSFMGCCYNVIVLFFFHVKKNKTKKWWWGVCAHPAALHALQWSRRVLLMEAGLTFDLLSGSKSGSRGSAAGQGTIANTREPRRKKRTTCGGVFKEATQGGTQHNAGLNPCKPNTMPEYEYRVGILYDVSQSLSVAVLSEKCCNAHRG